MSELRKILGVRSGSFLPVLCHALQVAIRLRLVSKERTMQQLQMNEITMVSGGCAEYCWGDFEMGALFANTLGGAVAGSFSGPMGMLGGGVGAAVAYMFDVMWTD
jgi:hypothetical protein